MQPDSHHGLLGRRQAPQTLGLLARLNAAVARLYELSDKEFAHVLGTFPLVSPEERDLAHREFARLCM